MPTPAHRVRANQLIASNRPLLAAAPQKRRPLDSQRTDVFQPGPDGKLHPVPGWTTTGAFDFGRWTRNINLPGVARDLALIAASSIGGGGLQGLGALRGVTGVTGGGLTAADGVTLGAGTYVVGDRTMESMAPKQRPKHW
ncbi:hypothetical protein [Phenylobacterium sp.]|uniref:hypothetical protein n=1 Tax=Phenylobacterium sp. TaxID=1871053 RepID=UPI00271F46D9|nr:hypothetical protein [Phenylobacterium sp.]MDO8799774.1 hypothetical protein [Phenylobacterium sp.]